MKIAQAPSFLPLSLKDQIENQSPHDPNTPGLLVVVDDILKQYPNLRSGIANIPFKETPASAPCLVVEPDQVSSILASDAGLDLIKTIASAVAQQIHPHLKTGIDAIWLVYGAKKLYTDWNQPDRDTVSCLFKATGLAMGVTGVIGNVYPDIKIPDHWANGVNFIVKGGGAIYEGKTLPINEMILSADKRLKIPLKFLKFAGIALDPDPAFQSISVRQLQPAIISSHARNT